MRRADSPFRLLTTPLLMLAVFALGSALLPTAALAQQPDDDGPRPRGDEPDRPLRVPFVMLALNGSTCHVVENSAAEDLPLTLADAAKVGTRVPRSQLVTVLAALRSATGTLEGGSTRGGVVVLCRRDQPWASVAQLLMMCTHPRAQVSRVFIATPDRDAAGNRRLAVRMLFLPRDEGLSGPPAPVQQLRIRFRQLADRKGAYQIVPDPLNEYFRMIHWEAGRKGLSRMFWKLEGQLRDGHAYVGDTVEAAPDPAVPLDAVWRLLAALDRAEDNWAAEGKYLTITAPGPGSGPGRSDDGDDSDGDGDDAFDPAALRLRPGADAFTRFHVRGRLRVNLKPDGAPAPPQIEPDTILPEDPRDPDADDPAVPPVDPPDELRNPMDDQPDGPGIGSGDGDDDGGRTTGYADRADALADDRIGPRIKAALQWLHDHQGEDGNWSPDTFADDRAKSRTEGSYGNPNGSSDAGWEAATVGDTGLALLAFLGAGYTHTSEGDYGQTVRKALRYLKAVQGNDGCFDTTGRQDPHFVYGHAIATAAFVEAYAMTGSVMLKGPAQKAVDFIVQAQNRSIDGRLGWRYGVRPGDNDTSVTGWMALALASAKRAGLTVPQDSLDGAIRLLDHMTGSWNGYPKTGYIQKAGQNARLQSQANFLPNGSMDAINITVRLLVTGNANLRRSSMVRGQAGMLVSRDALPTLEDPNKRDFYYWYYGSRALFQVGGNQWVKWRRAVTDALLGSQRMDGDASHKLHGSWDTDSAWGVAGGRVYTTALNCLTLETPWRHARVGAADEADDDEDGDGD